MPFFAERSSEPRMRIRHLLGPGDEGNYPSDAPDHYVELYGLTPEEAKAFVRAATRESSEEVVES